MRHDRYFVFAGSVADILEVDEHPKKNPPLAFWSENFQIFFENKGWLKFKSQLRDQHAHTDLVCGTCPLKHDILYKIPYSDWSYLPFLCSKF